MKKERNNEFMTVEEAAAVLNLKAKTIYNRKAGTASLLRVKQGRNVRLLRKEVLAHQQNLINEAKRIHKLIEGVN